jgi:N-formylglutamate deformylase
MQPFRVLAPAGASVPLLYDSPHSGREYPPDFGAAAPMADLRRAEDAHVDQLIDLAPGHGVTVLLALVPRCYIDLNRAEDDVDPAMLEDPGPDWSPTVKSERGLGLIRKLVMPGMPVYDRRLTTREVRERIERVYRPYHEALRRLADELLARHGRVWHVNWHSMKSVGNAMTPDGPDALRPDFVVGDLDGASADPAVTATVAGLLRDLGHTVALNEPYAGGRIVRNLGSPAAGVHSIQIEVNRKLYLDEPRATKSGRFLGLRADLDRFTRRLAQAARTPDS